jgi:hypothetical protein
VRRPEWRTVRASTSALAGVAAALATAYLALVNAKVWEGTDRQKFWAVVTIAAVAIGSSLARPIRIFVVGKQVKQSNKIHTALRGLPWAINKQTGGRVPVPPLGASAWLIKGWGKRRYLKNIGRERVEDYPGPSSIKWTKGKGVLGKAWQEERAQIIDVGKIDARHGKCSEEQWLKVRDDTRMGLSYQEYCKIRGKYGTVVVAPMFDPRNSKVIGFVSLDAPVGVHQELESADAVGAVSSAARVIADLLG